MSYDNRQFIGLSQPHQDLIEDAVKKAREQGGMQTERGKDGSKAYAWIEAGEIKWELTEPRKLRKGEPAHHLCTALGVWPKTKGAR